ncbi:MAG: DUF4397 domain-containing protein [Myxococcota bacterium]
MKRWLLLVLAATACTETEPTNYDVLPPPPPDGWAQLRLLHVMADTPALDVYLRETRDPVLSSLGHGFAQGFIEVAARSYTVDLRLAAASPNSEVMSSFEITLASRERVTVVLAGTAEALMPVRFADDLARVALGALRLVNATSSGPVSFDLGADGSDELAQLEVGGVGRATSPDLSAVALSVAADSGAQVYQVPARPSEGDVVIVAADAATLMLTYSFSVTELAPP